MTGDSPFRPLEEKLSLDDLRRFQRLMGERAVFEADQGADASKVWTDLLDARGVGFSKEEMLEYALGVEAESPRLIVGGHPSQDPHQGFAVGGEGPALA